MPQAFDRLAEEKKQLILNASLKEFCQKTYQDANTDLIVKDCDISKGSLYYYFGSKKELYFYLLDHVLTKLTAIQAERVPEPTFRDYIRSSWDNRVNQMRRFPLEITFINNAARDRSTEIYERKEQVLQEYTVMVNDLSLETLKDALMKEKVKPGVDLDMAAKGLSVYISSLIMDMLKRYSDKPTQLFEDSENIMDEIEQYLQIFLSGVISSDD